MYNVLTVLRTYAFTFHYVSIKSQAATSDENTFKAFTFHYVSIKSLEYVYTYCIKCDLHSTMYLLNQTARGGEREEKTNLHSTMYLLNP